MTENSRTALATIVGLGPLLAGARTLEGGVVLGLASLAVIAASTLLVAVAGRRLLPAWRAPVGLLLIAALVTAVDLVVAAGWFGLEADLGLLVPLIIVNGLVLASAEAAASGSPGQALRQALARGGSFTLLLAGFGAVREWLAPALPVAGLAPGALFLLAALLALHRAWSGRRQAA